MKKISVILCVLLIAVTLSACSAFHDDTTQTYPRDNPQETTVFLRVKEIPLGSTIDAELTRWEGKVLIAQPTNEDVTKIMTKPVVTPETNNIYSVTLTVQNMPDSTVQKVTRPFKITYHQTIYNPIALLPDDEVFEYYVLYGSERRHSTASTESVQLQDDEYVYIWNDATTIEFTDVYPNRPLYYVIIFASVSAIGAIVYFISRYYDCKKRKYQL